jgi:hypothetical protein
MDKMTADARNFYGKLGLTFGPLFIVGGWLAAFTEVGAVLIVAGVVMVIVAPVLLQSWKLVPVALATVAVGLGWPFVVVR